MTNDGEFFLLCAPLRRGLDTEYASSAAPLSVGGKDLCVCVCHVCSNFYQRQSIHQTFSRLCDFCCVWKWRRQRKLLPMALHFIVLVQLLIQLLIVGFHLFRLTIWPLIDLPNEFFWGRGWGSKTFRRPQFIKKWPFASCRFGSETQIKGQLVQRKKKDN